MSPVLYGVPRTLAFSQPSPRCSRRQVRIGLETAGGEDDGFGAQVTGPSEVVTYDANDAAVLDDEALWPRGRSGRRCQVGGYPGVVGDQAFAAADVADMQPPQNR